MNFLQLNRINTEGIASLVRNPSGNINIINGSNIIFTGTSGQAPFYLDNEKNTVKALTLSNYYGPAKIAGGRTRILVEKGDAF